MFADWLMFASAFSIFLENEISHMTRGNKQLKFLEISITGYFGLTQQSKQKEKLVFRQREISSTYVGTERKTLTRFPPVMRSGPFGFSLTL